MYNIFLSFVSFSLRIEPQPPSLHHLKLFGRPPSVKSKHPFLQQTHKWFSCTWFAIKDKSVDLSVYSLLSMYRISTLITIETILYTVRRA